MISLPVDNLTLATLRSALLGFLGLTIYTFKQTPFFWGAPSKAGDAGGRVRLFLGCFMSWLRVANVEFIWQKRDSLYVSANKDFCLRCLTKQGKLFDWSWLLLCRWFDGIYISRFDDATLIACFHRSNSIVCSGKYVSKIA